MKKQADFLPHHKRFHRLLPPAAYGPSPHYRIGWQAQAEIRHPFLPPALCPRQPHSLWRLPRTPDRSASRQACCILSLPHTSKALHRIGPPGQTVSDHNARPHKQPLLHPVLPKEKVCCRRPAFRRRHLPPARSAVLSPPAPTRHSPIHPPHISAAGSYFPPVYS